jgi:hypothetical protein
MLLPMNRAQFLATLLFATSLAFGQTGLATLTGTITDASGAVVAGAPVSLSNLELKWALVTTMVVSVPAHFVARLTF